MELVELLPENFHHRIHAQLEIFVFFQLLLDSAFRYRKNLGLEFLRHYSILPRISASLSRSILPDRVGKAPLQSFKDTVNVRIYFPWLLLCIGQFFTAQLKIDKSFPEPFHDYSMPDHSRSSATNDKEFPIILSPT
ncbi:MAG: hypothetical protein R2864_14535 [Syntrophotaleaceae bacterium]